MSSFCRPCGVPDIACVRQISLVPVVLFRTAAFRLALLQALLFALFAVVLLGLVWQVVNKSAEGQRRNAVKAQMASLLQASVDGTLRAQLNQQLAVMPQGPNYFLLTDRNGQRLTGNLVYHPLSAGWHIVRLRGALGQDSSDADSVQLFSSRLPDGRWLVVGSDNRSLIELGEVLSGRFMVSGGMAILLVLIAGGLTSQRYLRRVDELGERAERILEGEQGLTITSSSRDDEFNRLAIRLNRIIARMRVLMDGMRQVSNDIAHDLRTPLTRMRQQLEAGLEEAPEQAPLRGVIEQVVVEVDRLLGTFRAMLRIAHVEARQRKAGFEQLDLSEVFADVAEIYHPVAEDRGQQLRTSIERGHALRGDRALLTQMLANLIENALHHTPSGTCIQLGLTSAPDALTGYVSDNGQGIPVDARERVLGRFVRLDSSRTIAGDGLGLALVAAVADLHSIKLTMGDSQPGLLVELEFKQNRLALPSR